MVNFSQPTQVRYNKGNNTVVYLTHDDTGTPFAVLGLPDMVAEEMEQCIVLGPPDLSSLPLNDKQRKELAAELVRAGFITAPDLVGKRRELKALVHRIGLPVGMDRYILYVYQKEFYHE